MRTFGKSNKESAKEMAKWLLERAFLVYPEFKPEIEKRLENIA